MQSLKTKNKQFLIRAVLFLLIIICIDQLIGAVLYYFFTHQNTGEFAVANHVAFNKDEEILVLGSSRASHHYNSSTIKNSFGLNCYNGGRDGEGLLYSTAMLQLALQHHIPQYVILDINSDALDQNKDEKDKLSILLPFLQQSDVIKDIVKERSPFEMYKSLSKTYRYNGQVLSILQHHFLPSSKYILGFNALDEKMDASKVTTKTAFTPYADLVDPANIKALVSFITICKTNQVQLFVFISPRYNDDTKLNSYVKIKNLCKDHHIPFQDFTNNLVFKRPEYYADRAHLNGIGANLYTDTVISFIKKNIQTNKAMYLTQEQ